MWVVLFEYPMILSVCRSIFHRMLTVLWKFCHPMLQIICCDFILKIVQFFFPFFVFTLLVYSHVMIFCCLFLGFISVYHVQNPTGVSAWCSVGVQGIVSQTIDFLWCKCLMIKDNIDIVKTKTFYVNGQIRKPYEILLCNNYKYLNVFF